MTDKELIRLPTEIRKALAESRPLVALESTVISHGLPLPLNLEVAFALEEAVRREGAIPATVGVVRGVPTVGLCEDELRIFATGTSPDGLPVEKVGLNNLALVMVRERWGATTVAATMRLARLAGVRVFATGGIGGVHRGASDSFDVSADLTVLADTPMLCVCAGPKSILDIQATAQYLETRGVPLIGYGTDQLPAFYSRNSGLPVDAAVSTPEEVNQLAAMHWRTGSSTAVLVCVPPPVEVELPLSEIERAMSKALDEARSEGVGRKQLTPFLLARLAKLTQGRTLEANKALLINNAMIAARIAVSI